MDYRLGDRYSTMEYLFERIFAKINIIEIVTANSLARLRLYLYLRKISRRRKIIFRVPKWFMPPRTYQY